MKKDFGRLPDGTMASLYTISCGKLRAEISDLGATLVRLYVPDSEGVLADVVLGFDCPEDYIASGTFMGAVVGRNANRVKNAAFVFTIFPNKISVPTEINSTIIFYLLS